jgi:hypothetical protein
MRIPFALAITFLGACSSADAADGANASFPPDAITTVPTDDGTLVVAVRTSPSQPPPRGTCTVELTITDAAGAPKDGLALDVVPWMPSHGHGASTKPAVLAKGGGNYVVTDVNFFMPGEWELRTTIGGASHADPRLTIP